jgi:hypothetical protein
MFSALALVVVVTTMLTPPLLRMLLPARPEPRPTEPHEVGELITEA